MKIVKYSISIYVILCAIFCTAYGTDYKCDKKYYLNEYDECTACPKNFYCPGDDEYHKCPNDTTDWLGYLTALGYDVIDIQTTEQKAWSSYGEPCDNAKQCYADAWVQFSNGAALIESPYNGTDYWEGENRILFYSAKPGYYLSSYNWTSFHDWYHRIKQCTNAPEYAHYTGAGTPDEPKENGQKDFNDCPWECDIGLGKFENKCVPLCTAGVTKLRTDNLSFNIYLNVQTHPSLNIEYNNQVCYIGLIPGRAVNAINVEYKGQIYHTMD